MKIIVINGSTRGRRGNTQIMVEAFAEGVVQAGGTLETLFLVDYEIAECLACFECWIDPAGACVQKDDAAELIERVMAADLAVFATPLYVDNVSGLTKLFLDRMLPIFDPHFEKDEQGEYRHRKRFDRYPLLGVISNSGYPEQSHFQVLRLLFRRLARNLHTRLVLEIYRGGGEILGADSIFLRPIVRRYRKLLVRAGREIVERGVLSDALVKALEKPLMPHDLYVRSANKYWERKRKKRGLDGG